MPKKKESQPVQVWLKNADCVRLKNMAKQLNRSQSEISREAICRVLDHFEEQLETKKAHDDLFDAYTVSAKKVLDVAREEALYLAASKIGTEHLLLGLTADATSSVGKNLNRLGFTWKSVKNRLIRNRDLLQRWRTEGVVNSVDPSKLDYSVDARNALIRAKKLADELKDRVILPEHILLSLLQSGKGGAFDIFQGVGIDDELVLREVILRGRPIIPPQPPGRAKRNKKQIPRAE